MDSGRVLRPREMILLTRGFRLAYHCNKILNTSVHAMGAIQTYFETYLRVLCDAENKMTAWCVEAERVIGSE